MQADIPQNIFCNNKPVDTFLTHTKKSVSYLTWDKCKNAIPKTLMHNLISGHRKNQRIFAPENICIQKTYDQLPDPTEHFVEIQVRGCSAKAESNQNSYLFLFNSPGNFLFFLTCFLFLHHFKMNSWRVNFHLYLRLYLLHFSSCTLTEVLLLAQLLRFYAFSGGVSLNFTRSLCDRPIVPPRQTKAWNTHAVNVIRFYKNHQNSYLSERLKKPSFWLI